MPGNSGVGRNGSIFAETALMRLAGMRLPGNGVRSAGSAELAGIVDGARNFAEIALGACATVGRVLRPASAPPRR